MPLDRKKRTLISPLLLLFAFVFFGQVQHGFAADVTLAWDAITQPELAGYKVYVGTSSRNYGAGTNVGIVTQYTVTGLGPGTYYFAVTAYDATGRETGYSNEVSETILSADTTPPAVSITSPTSSSTYATGSSSLGIGGSASDNVAVTQVTWANNRGGSGTATGTSSWSVSGITLLSGSNVITVTARDAAGNTATDTLTVTYAPADTTPPAVSITSPTSSSTYATGSSSLGIGGSASDNVAVTQVTWANNRGGSGTATGTSSWSVGGATGITLQSGVNVITVTARDAAGNTATDTLTVTYTPPDTTPLVISNVSASGVTATSANISWSTNKASDSQVEYGTSTSYGNLTPLNSSMVTSHTQSLSGLARGTLYHYRVRSEGRRRKSRDLR